MAKDSATPAPQIICGVKRWFQSQNMLAGQRALAASRGGMTEKAVASASASVAEGASALALIVPMGLEPVEALIR